MSELQHAFINVLVQLIYEFLSKICSLTVKLYIELSILKFHIIHTNFNVEGYVNDMAVLSLIYISPCISLLCLRKTSWIVCDRILASSLGTYLT